MWREVKRGGFSHEQDGPHRTKNLHQVHQACCHAYFLGASDPYKALKATLKAEINEEAWETLHSDTSRPFDKPEDGRIAVKVINHLGDEVMKVFGVG